MEIWLLYLNAFLRPLLSIDLTGGKADLQTLSRLAEIYNWVAVGLFILLAAAFLAGLGTRKNLRLSAVDLIIAAFAVWCLTAFVVYIDKANVRELIKLLFPLFTYFVAKNVLQDGSQYRRMILLMILGFVIPVVWSAGLLLQGAGVESVNYWTQEPRYKGIYPGAHNLAHSMTFLLMLILLYFAVADPSITHKSRIRRYAPAALLALAALYCLFLAHVRTTLVGLLIFALYYLYAYQRHLFLYYVLGGVALAVALAPFYFDTLFYEVDRVQSGEWGSEYLASGRPGVWKNNLEIFAAMPLDRQLAGVGIGNKIGLGGEEEGIYDSHNDYLDTMIQTGVVGLTLYLLLQLLLLKAILGMAGREKHAFLALFAAVVAMNFLSNSYITRSFMAQLYFLVMAYVEIAQRSDTARSRTVEAEGEKIPAPQRFAIARRER